MRRITGLLACATIALVAVTVVPVVNAVNALNVVNGAGQSGQEPDKGEQIQNGSCGTTCHDLRPIQTQALDKDGWTKIVSAMVDKGAQVKPDEVPVLVAYLVKSHGPLPDGAGKLILLNTCTLCHELDRVMRQGGTREEWEETLSAMLNEGAMLSEQDFPVLLAYLAKNFKPQ
jgi:cytochrome c5